MNDNMTVTCPNCGGTISLSETQYMHIASQVRDAEFLRQVESRARELSEKAVIETRLSMSGEISEKERALLESRVEMESLVSKHTAELEQVRSSMNGVIRGLEEELDFYKDFKARSSTKMIGESLETYCSDAFEMVRAMGFPRAEFHKDNEVSESGSKGDFIFRDFDSEGIEIVSVMLEMKNESDSDSRKHKNSEFFRELDKDRREKGCEYAVLVTMLEPDSELYNSGIVDVSHVFPKMYVVRPQFMVPMLTLLRNLGLNCIADRKEIARMREESLDVVRFEEQLGIFRDGFDRNCRLASDRFSKAIEGIDKAIAFLNKVKEDLSGSDRQLELARRKADDLTIRKLCKDNQTMMAKFDEARKASREE